MVAGNYDLNIDQGATFVLQLTIQQADGTAYNLTNYTPKAQIRNTYGGTLAAEITCTKLSDEDGILQLSLTAAQTLLLTDTTYKWDIYIEDTPEIIRLLDGIANVAPAVTVTTPAPEE